MLPHRFTSQEVEMNSVQRELRYILKPIQIFVFTTCIIYLAVICTLRDLLYRLAEQYILLYYYIFSLKTVRDSRYRRYSD
jgi:hypothetical protein